MHRSVRSGLHLDGVLAHVRSATIWLGIGCFFLGALGVGSALSTGHVGGAGRTGAPALSLLAFGVAYVGIGLLAPQTGARYEVEVDLPEWGRALVAPLAGVSLVCGALALTVAL